MIIACVRTGNKYPVDYVYKLKAMVERHLSIHHSFICLTDRPQDLEGVETVKISDPDLIGWWGKMTLFEFSYYSDEQILYFDLDSVICDDILPLAILKTDFAVCANFTRAAGIDWPCSYGSCVMSIAPGFGEEIYHGFMAKKKEWMDKAGRYGDQRAIELICPDADLLQDVLPKGFFLGYRNITEKKPEGCSVVVFAGIHKPHNCEQKWIKDEWHV